jgi:6-phosphogluconate dehydrogenase
MQIGIVGTGKMGLQIARRLQAAGVQVTAHDQAEQARRSAAAGGVATAESLAELVRLLKAPRVLWVMVPSGGPTAAVVNTLVEALEPGDVIVDGGNSHYQESRRHAEAAAGRGVGFVDCGTSGGIHGEADGFCLMVGGNPRDVSTAEPYFRILAQVGGYLHVGPSGSGHYTKMIHNAVEYALMEAYGEGFELLAARGEFAIDLEAVARLWGKGSVVRSWLLELAADALARDPGLATVRGYVADTGEGRWAAVEAIEQGVPIPGILLALAQRQRSRQDDSFSARVVAALRQQFGGHEVVSISKQK